MRTPLSNDGTAPPLPLPPPLPSARVLALMSMLVLVTVLELVVVLIPSKVRDTELRKAEEQEAMLCWFEMIGKEATAAAEAEAEASARAGSGRPRHLLLTRGTPMPAVAGESWLSTLCSVDNYYDGEGGEVLR